MRICPNCGMERSEVDKFCTACGAALEVSVVESVEPAERANLVEAVETTGTEATAKVVDADTEVADVATDTEVADAKTIADGNTASHNATPGLPSSSSVSSAQPQPVPDYTIWAVLELFYCLPLGLVAVLASLQSYSALSAGRNDFAIRKATQAKKCINWGLCLLSISFMAFMVFFFYVTTVKWNCWNSSDKVGIAISRGLLKPTGEVTIPSRILGQPVTSIGKDAFAYCSGLTSVTIPSGVTSIGDAAFAGCDSLKSITIPASVTSIGQDAFTFSGLTSITIPEGVTSIGDSAFRGCSGLTSITISEGVTSIGEEAFAYCSGLTSITIPEGVTTIGNSAFAYCHGLTSVTIPSGVTSIGWGAFWSCSKYLTIRRVPEEAADDDAAADDAAAPAA